MSRITVEVVDSLSHQTKIAYVQCDGCGFECTLEELDGFIDDLNQAEWLLEQATKNTQETLTQRNYPCGCSASGFGNLPNYCAVHGPTPITLPRPSMLEDEFNDNDGDWHVGSDPWGHGYGL